MSGLKQWRNTLKTCAAPVFGSMLVRDVALPNVMAALEPIWAKKAETASRLRGRIELVLDWATARGLREGPNPARWCGRLDKLLPTPSKVKKVEHHVALPVGDVGAFMAQLREIEARGECRTCADRTIEQAGAPTPPAVGPVVASPARSLH